MNGLYSLEMGVIFWITIYLYNLTITIGNMITTQFMMNLLMVCDNILKSAERMDAPEIMQGSVAYTSINEI